MRNEYTSDYCPKCRQYSLRRSPTHWTCTNPHCGFSRERKLHIDTTIPFLRIVQMKGRDTKKFLEDVAARPEQPRLPTGVYSFRPYIKEGMVFRRWSDGTLEFLGPVYKAWKELRQ